MWKSDVGLGSGVAAMEGPVHVLGDWGRVTVQDGSAQRLEGVGLGLGLRMTTVSCVGGSGIGSGSGSVSGWGTTTGSGGGGAVWGGARSAGEPNVAVVGCAGEGTSIS